MTAIRCTNLHKTYGGRTPVEAVRGIDLEVATGECFGVLGPNGAGKTTTIEILEGMLAPTSGDVRIFDMDWETQGDEIRDKIGISLQETRFSDKLTVRETVALFRSFYRQGIHPDEAIARVSLEEKNGTYVKDLSGGQQQRLAVATALVGDPELLFLDEPTTGLDPQSRRQLWDVVWDFRDLGRSVLLTTHYMEEAERLCDRVAIVDRGKVIALGSPRELIASLGGEHVIDFSLTEQDDGADGSEWRDLPTVTDCRSERGSWHLSVGEPHTVLPALLERIRDRGLQLANLSTRHASLDDVFVKLTGRQLEDGEEP